MAIKKTKEQAARDDFNQQALLWKEDYKKSVIREKHEMAARPLRDRL